MSVPPWGEQSQEVSPKGNRAMRGSPGVQCCGGTPLMGVRSPGRMGRRGWEPWGIPWGDHSFEGSPGEQCHGVSSWGKEQHQGSFPGGCAVGQGALGAAGSCQMPLPGQWVPLGC